MVPSMTTGHSQARLGRTRLSGHLLELESHLDGGGRYRSPNGCRNTKCPPAGLLQMFECLWPIASLCRDFCSSNFTNCQIMIRAVA